MLKSPIHPFSGIATMLLDSFWGVEEGIAALSVIGILAVPVLMLITGGLTFIISLLIQRFVAEDRWGAAFAKGLFLALLAGVPFPFMGTGAGVLFLAWSGLNLLGSRLLPSRT